MSNIIPFKTRAQLEQERREKHKKEWKEFIDLERRFGNYLDENKDNDEKTKND